MVDNVIQDRSKYLNKILYITLFLLIFSIIEIFTRNYSFRISLSLQTYFLSFCAHSLSFSQCFNLTLSIHLSFSRALLLLVILFTLFTQFLFLTISLFLSHSLSPVIHHPVFLTCTFLPNICPKY